MALSTLKRLWKNEYIQTAIMVAIMLGIVFGFWFGVQWTLHTEYPALAVASQSMMPTLNVGDLIIVQGISPDQVHANYLNGDILVFKSKYDPNELIVHRAVMGQNTSSGYVFYTKGDNVAGDKDQFSPWSASLLVGKVIGKIPWVGNFALIMHTRENMYLFAIVIIILIVVFLTLPFGSGKEEKSDQNPKAKEKRRLFGKIGIKMIYLLVVNVLLIVFLVFSLWGAFTFWQPGANMADKNVTIYGMYPDVQFYESYTAVYNHVQQVYISSGFLSYTINTYATDGMNTGLRTGVPAFSWTQAAILVLLIIDVWELMQFLRSKRKAKTATAEKSNSISANRQL